MMYDMIKKFINAKVYSKAEITKRLNVFYMAGQVTDEEYQELLSLIENKYS